MTPFLFAVSALRAAGEPTRLRLLVLLSRGELTVGELCDILGQSQPRISRHLKVLSSAGLLHRIREQNWVYYRTPPAGAGLELVTHLLGLVSPEDEVLRRDFKRMEHVLEQRVARLSASELAEEIDPALDAVVLSELAQFPIGALLDVGTGSGHWLRLLGAQATRAIGIDISTQALKAARTHVYGAGLSHCQLQHGDMYNLPFGAAMFDTATIDRVLGDSKHPVAALTEIGRTLKRDGRLVVIESFDTLADRAEGNPLTVLRQWLQRAGLECGRLHPIDSERGHLLVAVARATAQASAAA